MLFIDDPTILLSIKDFIPSNDFNFHKNMNIIAIDIILLFLIVASYTKKYEYYFKQCLIFLFIFTIFIHIVENSNDISIIEGLSPTNITDSIKVNDVSIVKRSPSFESEGTRGRQFFKDSDPHQGPRPLIRKRKNKSMYF